MHKITSSRLRQIISEEVSRFIAESDGEAEVPAGKKMIQAAQGMVGLKDAIDKFKETSPDAASAIETQLADLEKILDTKLEPLQSLVTPASAPGAKFKGPQDLHPVPDEDADVEDAADAGDFEGGSDEDDSGEEDDDEVELY